MFGYLTWSINNAMLTTSRSVRCGAEFSVRGGVVVIGMNDDRGTICLLSALLDILGE